MQRLLKILKLLIVIATVSSCQSVQKPQNIWDCRIIWELQMGFCINNTTLEEKDIPLESMDKYTAFSPKDWGEILIYIKQLEAVTPSKYRDKYFRFNKLNKKHIEIRNNMLY